MAHQKYVIWRSGKDLKFRVGNDVHAVEWSMSKERELQKLMAQWMEELPDVE